MRVSTAQFYFQNSQQLTSKQSNVNDQMGYLSSGKRVLTAKDDAVAYGTLAGYKDELANIEKYKRNITQAENRNSLQDNAFANAENMMQELKRIFTQANNGTLSSDDLVSLAEQAKNSQSQLLDIANTKDETGGYIFAGFQTHKEPFSLQLDNTVTYQGDSGIRQLQIAKNVFVETNQPGDLAFAKIANDIGDFGTNYINNSSGFSVNNATVVDPSSYDTTTNPPNYKLSFSAPNDLTVTDGNGAVVVPSAPYVAGQTIAFNGVEVQLSGNPLPGDEVDLYPQQEVNIFSTIKAAIDWMASGSTPANPLQHEVDYAHILSQLDQGLNHLTTRRSESGIRLQLIDSQANNHADTELTLASGKSNIEDLDFAKAVANFEQSKVALQAAQQSFVQVKDLNLFNFI
ncbi:flagellar hook-associated protein 3 FlgL [Colwellia chukchiensis]|uniref:Flagellar hook-associated protein 3 FlgL n=1 Tax=Colwellia chukchiensis TaxID=641665 RepID=A0A1H7HI55_9GAMM|nr:flagellar hook-associated protein FlgL [Colwellia chukchiensis]SEK49848.1 flagellar hook-associated protein 3 FlgL [Colwellia chukchiensis]